MPIHGSSAYVHLKHQISVFRIVATLQNLPYSPDDDSPYIHARINSLRISAVDPTENVDEGEDPVEQVFLKTSGLDVTTDSFTGEPYPLEWGSQDYYLLRSDDYSMFYMPEDEPVTKIFFVPVRFGKDLEAGFELRLQFGGNYYNVERGRRVSTDVYPVGDKRKLITTTLPLENGKLYKMEVTI